MTTQESKHESSNIIGLITLVVQDYDEAIDFYTQKLGFVLIEDTNIHPNKRWVVVGPSLNSAHLLLAKAGNEQQVNCIGNQTGGRVALFLYVNDFDTFYQNLIANGVTIVREAHQETYGKVAVFADLYGNKWDLLSRTTQDSE